MNVTDAAYATVHDYEGGAAALAPRLGMSAAILRAKVCPSTDRNKLMLDEADKLMGLTGDYRILQALNAEHGFAMQPLPEREHDARESLGELVLDSNIAAGKFAGAIRDALSDGLISEREMKAISAAGLAEQAVIMALMDKLRMATGKHLRVAGGAQG